MLFHLATFLTSLQVWDVHQGVQNVINVAITHQARTEFITTYSWIGRLFRTYGTSRLFIYLGYNYLHWSIIILFR
jgi:hypothetical protein